jgi:Pregnancy-associated plasma protein-A
MFKKELLIAHTRVNPFFVSVVLVLLMFSVPIEGHNHHHHDDEAGHSHNDHSNEVRDLQQRGSFVLGDRVYASQQEFIDSGARCGTKDLSKDEKEINELTLRDWVANNKASGNGFNLRATTEISTFFHIITNGAKGNKTDDVLEEQLNVLNIGFEGTGFTFVLDNVTRTDKAAWRNIDYGDANSEKMKDQLHQGGPETLNVYLTSLKNGLLGWATFPSGYIGDPTLDGVVIATETIPGGSLSPFDEGLTLVHEVGHWMGLYHTFQPSELGCNGSGDDIFDTPAQLTSTGGCPTGKDTCPLRRGKDPIHNYMDYSDDDCYEEFTQGQVKRMQAAWGAYRSGETSPLRCPDYRTQFSCRRNYCFWSQGECY